MPRSLDRNDSGSKLSRSAGFSPVPINMTGAFTSAQAVNAPPAFAV